MNIKNIQEKLNPYMAKISGNRYMKAIMGGMMAAMPVTFIGSFASIIKNLPIEAYQTFLETFGLAKFLDVPIILSQNLIALIAVFSIGYTVAKSFGKNALSAGLICLVSFLILTPITTEVSEFGVVSYSLSMTWLGSQGLFTAFIVGFLASRLYVYIVDKNWTIKMPDSVPEVVSGAFSSLIPGLLVLSLFTVISALFTLTSYASIHQFIYTMIQKPISGFGSNIVSLMILSIIAQLLWVFGIHGGMIVLSTIAVALMPLDIANQMAYAAGDPLPNSTGMMFFLQATPGVTLPLICLCLFVGKSKRYKVLGKFSVIPGIFGIDEPMIFGTPLVMNFRFFIPFVFQGALCLGATYLLIEAGILPRMNGLAIPTGTPILLGGLIQGGWRMALWQGVTVLLRIPLWYPFFVGADKEAYAQEIASESNDGNEVTAN